jgi:hypothetical protein
MQGSEKHRILDQYRQHWFLQSFYKVLDLGYHMKYSKYVKVVVCKQLPNLYCSVMYSTC